MKCADLQEAGSPGSRRCCCPASAAVPGRVCVFIYLEQFMIPLEVRDVIDAAVHSVIADAYQRYPNGLESRCAHYAIVGAKCLCRLTGDGFIPVSGSQRIPLVTGGSHTITPPQIDLDAAKQLSDLRNYHCWIELPHAESIERVDFTLRHNKAACQVLGISLAQPCAETYAWARLPRQQIGVAQPDERHGYVSCLSRDSQLTQLLWEFQFEYQQVFEVLTQQAMQKITEGLECLCQQAQHGH